MKRIVTLSISDELIEKIDNMRGLASRSAVVENILRKNSKQSGDNCVTP
jgi:metal-responsive CopG/Arc/MetJ family transcriptional regulator